MRDEPDLRLLPLIDESLNASSWLPPLPHELRAAYRADQRAARRPNNRRVVIGLTIIFDLFLFAQFKSAPELVPLSAALRMLVFTPACLLFLALDRRFRLDRLYEPTLLLLAGMAAVFSAILCVRTTSPDTLSDLRATPLILLTTGLMLRLSPQAVFVNCFVAASSFLTGILISPIVPRAELGSLIATDLAVAAATIVFSLMLEQRDRSVFLIRTADSIRRADLATRNTTLLAASQTDALTGVGNRRAFDDALCAAWESCLRAGQPLGLLMMDIDHFKAYNDHYGHQGGDQCLARVAALAQTQIRAIDLLARYGGEEFGVVMVGASAIVVNMIAERVRAQIELAQLPHAGIAGQVTLSIGAASMVPRMQNAQRQLVERADHCLYEAKRAGRNRVSCAV